VGENRPRIAALIGDYLTAKQAADAGDRGIEGGKQALTVDLRLGEEADQRKSTGGTRHIEQFQITVRARAMDEGCISADIKATFVPGAGGCVSDFKAARGDGADFLVAAKPCWSGCR